MSIGRALAEYISHQRHEKLLPTDPGYDKNPKPLPPYILSDEEASIFPDVVNFVDQTSGPESLLIDGEGRSREGMAYGIVSDILAPRYGGEARIASVVFDFANRANNAELMERQPSRTQEARFERAFSAILNILSILPEGMRVEGGLPAFDGQFHYTVSSLQVTDSARILISTGFMRGYIIVDVGYTQE